MSINNDKPVFCEYTDIELAQMIKDGNDLAFEEIVFRYSRLIASIASKYKAEGFETNDFIQEGLLSLLSACKTYSTQSPASFKNYAALCVNNKFITIIRKSQLKGAIPKENIVSIDDVEGFNDESTDPEQLLLNKEYLQSLLASLKNKLSSMELQVFSQYLAGCTYVEMSRRLNLSVKAIDNALQRIRKKLHQ